MNERVRGVRGDLYFFPPNKINGQLHSIVNGWCEEVMSDVNIRWR